MSFLILLLRFKQQPSDFNFGIFAFLIIGGELIIALKSFKLSFKISFSVHTLIIVN